MPPSRYQRRPAQRQSSDGKSWAQWKEELYEAIEQLDYACSEARQIIYQLRPLVRPKMRQQPSAGPEQEQGDEEGD